MSTVEDCESTDFLSFEDDSVYFTYSLDLTSWNTHPSCHRSG